MTIVKLSCNQRALQRWATQVCKGYRLLLIALSRPSGHVRDNRQDKNGDASHVEECTKEEGDDQQRNEFQKK